MITINEAIEREQQNVAELIEILDKVERDNKQLTPAAIRIFNEVLASIGETGEVIKQRLDDLIARQ